MNNETQQGKKRNWKTYSVSKTLTPKSSGSGFSRKTQIRVPFLLDLISCGEERN